MPLDSDVLDVDVSLFGASLEDDSEGSCSFRPRRLSIENLSADGAVIIFLS